jgi:hypothetical protein
MAMTRSRRVAVADIDAVRSRFEQWRRTRQGKAPIPDELWSAAIELARRNGINRTAAPLRLDGGKLKRLMLAAGRSSRRTAPPKFVELMPPAAVPSGSGVAECTLELEGHSRKLRIHCKGASAAELAALSRALWGLGS